MPHWGKRLRVAVVGPCVAAVVIAAACSGRETGELRIVADTTMARRTVEVLAVPFDPTAILRHARSSVAGDSARFARAARDSVKTLRRAIANSAHDADKRFQRERDAINATTRALARRDRHAPSYAAAVSAVERRIAGAEALRARRDRLRARLAALPDVQDDDAPRDGWRAALTRAAHAAGASLVQRRVVAPDTVQVTLAPGRWWIVIADRDDVRVVPRTREVRAGSSDTLYLQ
ncbi:MAG TPA: hypothetical protein VFK13_11430 [Gemmatimonadaceae bacterium]|nr:hypothetical protein [Gemmatimonadaceae bacterium]